MTPMKQKDCNELAKALKVLGWTPCTGAVMSFGEHLGHKIGVLVKVGDDRFKWREPNKPKEIQSDQIDHIGLSNFFASAHVVGKNRAMATQPVGFSSSMAGEGMVEIAPGANESLKEFLSKIRKISNLHVQIDLFSFETSEPEQKVESVEQLDEVASEHAQPERPVERMRL